MPKGVTMTPRKVDKEARRKDIALAAIELFAERGFESTSIRQIAEAAGIGKGSIYEYFESKEVLILHSITVWMGMMEAAIQQQVHGIEDPVERLRAYVRHSMQTFLADDRIVRVAIAMFQMLLADETASSTYGITREMFLGFRKAIVDILLDGVSRKMFRPAVADDAERIAINLLAYLDGIGIHYYMDKGYFNLMEQVDLFLHRLLQDLLVEGAEGAAD